MEIVYIIVGLIVIAGIWGGLSNLIKKAKNYDRLKAQLDELDFQKAKLETEKSELQKQKEQFKQYAEEEKENIAILAKEKSDGFPWLAEAYAEYNYLQNLKTCDYLKYKSHPGKKSAKIVAQVARERRTVEKKLRMAQGIIKYYQSLFPFIEDYLGEVEDEILKIVLSREVDKPIEKAEIYWERGIDPTLLYLSKEEYQKLNSTQRNQLALDRYWTRKKNRFEIGRNYERYTGYHYEIDGWHVYYQGILEGFEDMGRDLIVKKGNETKVIQCKNWADFRTIHENHINQLFGTMIKYKIENPKEKNVSGSFYTSTKLSDRAREFAKALEIEVNEGIKFENYPCIKCNISRKNGDKIYHLPFDQQYDKTLVEEERLEFYANTIEEAEGKGFRRAFRWHGNQ